MKKWLIFVVGFAFLLMSSYFVSASAIAIGCEFKVEVFGDDLQTFFKVIQINGESCNDKVEINQIYSLNDSSKKIKVGMTLEVMKQSACSIDSLGNAICSDWWTTNYTDYPTDIIDFKKRSCQKKDDCSVYKGSSAKETDCGGCRENVCFEYTPANCYLYTNNVGCVNNTCVAQVKSSGENFWQKIMYWFRRLF